MKKILFIALFAITAMTAVSCKIDTYDAPAETLTGNLICPDGTNLITVQPNGFKIRLSEVVNGKITSTPQDFWGKADGTFRNTKIFKGTYVVQPIEGAFFDVDPVEIDIKGEVNINFEVTPFVTIMADVTNNGPDLIARYKITKAEGAGKITKARILVSKWNPNVSMAYADYEDEKDLSGFGDDQIVKTTYTSQLLDILEDGVTYYARVAVLSENTSGRYNYSEVFTIQM